MYSKISKNLNKKGFSLVELIVVIAIIGILVMLAAPKFMGYTERAKVKRIQNDVKVVEGKIMEEYITSDYQFDGSIPHTELDTMIGDKTLYGVEGKIDKGNVEEGSYKEVGNNIIKEVRTKLKGKFYANADGKVYYVDDKVSEENIENNTGLNSNEALLHVSMGEKAISGPAAESIASLGNYFGIKVSNGSDIITPIYELEDNNVFINEATIIYQNEAMTEGSNDNKDKMVKIDKVETFFENGDFSSLAFVFKYKGEVVGFMDYLIFPEPMYLDKSHPAFDLLNPLPYMDKVESVKDNISFNKKLDKEFDIYFPVSGERLPLPELTKEDIVVSGINNNKFKLNIYNSDGSKLKLTKEISVMNAPSSGPGLGPGPGPAPMSKSPTPRNHEVINNINNNNNIVLQLRNGYKPTSEAMCFLLEGEINNHTNPNAENGRIKKITEFEKFYEYENKLILYENGSLYMVLFIPDISDEGFWYKVELGDVVVKDIFKEYIIGEDGLLYFIKSDIQLDNTSVQNAGIQKANLSAFDSDEAIIDVIEMNDILILITNKDKFYRVTFSEKDDECIAYEPLLFEEILIEDIKRGYKVVEDSIKILNIGYRGMIASNGIPPFNDKFSEVFDKLTVSKIKEVKVMGEGGELILVLDTDGNVWKWMHSSNEE